VQPGEHVHPHLHIAALEGPHRGLVLLGEVAEVPVLDPDHVRLAQGKIHLELHQLPQGGQGVRAVLHHFAAAVQQLLADRHQQIRQDRLLAGKVTVNGRAADACCCSKVLQRHPVEAVHGKQGGGGGQQRLAAVLLRLAALG
jgi:hypothetical protein